MDIRSIARAICAALLVASVLTNAAVSAPMPKLDCVIEPHMVSDISSKVDGVVDVINVDRSDMVKKGQVLVKLDARVEQAAVAYARRRAEADAELRANQTSAEFSERRLQRVKTLYQSQALSEDQMDETGTQKRLAKMELDRARENLELAGLDLIRAQANLDQRTITSPVDGIVIERYLSPGESVEEKPILRVAQIDPLRVEVIVPVAHMNDIVVGQQAKVSPENPVTNDYQATVTIVDRVADAASGTFRVRLTLPNPDYSVPAGLRCEVQFETAGSGPGVVASSQTPGAPSP